MKSRKVAALMAFGLIVAGFTAAPTASADSPKQCSQVKQPIMAEPTVNVNGAVFTWFGGEPPFMSEYSLSVSRKVNGSNSWGPYFHVGESLHEYAIPWVDKGIKAEAVALLVLAYCVDAQNAPTKWAYYSDYQKIADTEAAKAKAAAQAIIDAEVAKKVAAQQAAVPKKIRVECVNTKTREIKTFAKATCPKGWKVY